MIIREDGLLYSRFATFLLVPAGHGSCISGHVAQRVIQQVVRARWGDWAGEKAGHWGARCGLVGLS